MSGRMSGHNSPEIRHREQTLATRGAVATAVLASRPIAPVACIKLAMPSLASRRPAKPATDRHAAAAASSGYGCKPAARLTRSASLLMTDIVAKVPEERPGQRNSAIIESEWPVL